MWQLDLVAFLFGLVFGSFINVVGLRFLREESLMPRSYCYKCQARIKPYDNIPVLSWIILGGKCRNCKVPISIQYPAVELLTGLLFVATVHQFWLTWQTAFLLFLILNLVVILITDFREQYIYDINSLGLIPVGLVYSYLNLGNQSGVQPIDIGSLHWSVPQTFVSALIAVVGAFLLFFTLNLISRLLIGKPGFGEGDSRLLMGLGAFFGLKGIIVIFLVSFVVQATVGIPLLIRQWILQRVYKPALLLSASIALAGAPYLAQLWIPDGNTTLVLSLVCGVLAMVCVMQAMRLAKAQASGLTYLPFGPAIVFACLLFIFFEPHFTAWLARFVGA